ncbi:MAG: hypothetical protein FWE21_02695 [Defluviitaleaceae bacterium]|nr:hypothetical protein [Defluviitaleaceae bacterium]
MYKKIGMVALLALVMVMGGIISPQITSADTTRPLAASLNLSQHNVSLDGYVTTMLVEEAGLSIGLWVEYLPATQFGSDFSIRPQEAIPKLFVHEVRNAENGGLYINIAWVSLDKAMEVLGVNLLMDIGRRNIEAFEILDSMSLMRAGGNVNVSINFISPLAYSVSVTNRGFVPGITTITTSGRRLNGSNYIELHGTGPLLPGMTEASAGWTGSGNGDIVNFLTTSINTTFIHPSGVKGFGVGGGVVPNPFSVGIPHFYGGYDTN